MASRAKVFRFSAPDTIEIAYNHYDGYPDGLGSTLRKHYTDNTKVADLIGGGNWSGISDEDGEVEYYGDSPDIIKDENKDELLFKLADEVMSVGYAYMWDGERWFAYTPKNKESFVQDVARDMGYDINTDDMMMETYQRKWKKFIN
jgi:hypothetical protein